MVNKEFNIGGSRSMASPWASLSAICFAAKTACSLLQVPRRATVY